MKSQTQIKLPSGGSLTLTTAQTEREKLSMIKALLYEDWQELRSIIKTALVKHTFVSEDQTPSPWEDLEDYVLTSHTLTFVASELVQAARMPEEDIKELIKLGGITGSGGCECKICKDLVTNPDDRELSFCRYGTIKERAAIIFNITAPHFDSLTLQSPPFMWEVKTAFEKGKREAVKMARRKEQEKREVDALLGI